MRERSFIIIIASLVLLLAAFVNVCYQAGKTKHFPPIQMASDIAYDYFEEVAIYQDSLQGLK